MAKPDELTADQQAEYHKKLKLEKSFAPKIRHLIEIMALYLASTYKSSGVIINASNFEKDFERALTEHYNTVADAFIPFINGKLIEESAIAVAFDNFASKRGLNTSQAMRLVDDSQNQRIGNFITDSVSQSVELITATNNSEFAKAIDRASSTVADSGMPMTHDNIGTASQDAFLEANLFRAEVISQSETQKAAEGSKLEAASAIDDIINSAQPDYVPVFLKQWVTVGDDKVREAHAEAEGQTIDIQEPFDVGGEELRFPADPDGSPENVINCRCQSDYVENPDFDNSSDSGDNTDNQDQ